jgi:inner membrane transporter RhtA
VLALAGVALLGLSQEHAGHIDPIGMLFAAAAAVSWAGYILASARAAADFPRLDGLAVATMLGAAATAPLAFMAVDPALALHWDVVGLGIAVAVMSSVIPYSLELLSLRHLPAETFAVLTCISPVVAALAGWVVLDQQLTVAGYLAIALVTTASVGAVRSAHGPPAAVRAASPPEGFVGP